MKFLIQFDDARALDPGVVGRKFASLARASRLGFEVPYAAAVTTEAHRFFLSHRCWPDGLAAEVKAAGDMLGLSRGLSIRSSAVREDLENQSFAGQYRSFLQVDHADDLQNKIEMCWLSAEEENVRSYLRAGDRGNAAGEIPLMGVVLQRMVHAVAAGVAFGRNPLNPARDEIVIEGISGSGESLVNGHVSPHRAFVGGEGHLRIDLPPDAGPAARRSDCLLAESDWRRVAALLRRLEKSVGESPLDIEWAIDGGRTLWLLQYRRITTIEEGALDRAAGNLDPQDCRRPVGRSPDPVFGRHHAAERATLQPVPCIEDCRHTGGFPDAGGDQRISVSQLRRPPSGGRPSAASAADRRCAGPVSARRRG